MEGCWIMAKSHAYKVRLVQVVVREIYHHTVNRGGEEEAIIQAEDLYLNPIKDDSSTVIETVYNWDDVKHHETTEIFDEGIDDDGE